VPVLASPPEQGAAWENPDPLRERETVSDKDYY